MTRALSLACALLALAGCDDDGDSQPDVDAAADMQLDSEPPGFDAAPDMAAADAAAPDAAPDAAADEGAEPLEVDELRRLTVTVAEAGGLRLAFQLEIDFDEARTTFERFAIRAIDAADTPSPILAQATDVPFMGDMFSVDFGMVSIPADYNPAGVDIEVVLRLEGRVEADGLWCGDVRGAVPLFGLMLTESTFGAAVWPEPAPGACPGGEGPQPVFIGGDRPAEVLVPSDYDAGEPYPLLMVLHGYGASGRLQAGFLGLVERVEADGVIMVMPDGTVDATGRRHWQGRSCCGQGGEPVDDVAYLTGLIEEAKTTWTIDDTRVWAVGHSNGGFMAFDLACLAADTFTGIVSLAGSAGRAGLDCPGAGEVAVLDVHGTEDDTILYDGAAWHLGAEASVELWAERNACGPAADADPLDLLPSLDGPETTRREYTDCDRSVALWTLVGEGHVPQFNEAFGVETLRWLTEATR